MRTSARSNRYLHLISVVPRRGPWPTVPVLFTTLLVTLAIFQFRDSLLAPELPVRMLSLIPVAMAAYRADGALPGLALAAFFGSIFIMQDLASSGAQGEVSRAGALQTGMLCLVAYAAAEIARSFRIREGMTTALLDREALIDRSTEPWRLADFLVRLVREATHAEQTAVLWRDDINDCWWLTESHEHVRIVEGENQPALASWLISQSQQVLLNELQLDERFVEPVPQALLTQPVPAHNGELLGVLVALHLGAGRFTDHDAGALAQLATPAGYAIVQAGAHAHKERVAGRLTERLAAVGAAARELNRSLEPQEITRATLNWALTVTGGVAGFIEVEGAAGDRVAVEVRPVEGAEDVVATLIEQAASSTAFRSASCLRASIHRGDQAFGEVVIAPAPASAFDSADEQALTALAEHAGIALENASLMREVLRERSRAHQILQTMADGLMVTDEARRVTALNQAGQRLTGWSEVKATGQLACAVIGCDEPDPCHRQCALRRAQHLGKPSERERWLIRLPEGGERALALHAAPLLPPSPGATSPGLVVLLQDITEQEKMDQFQRELIAAFSHELRTPLASISTVVEMLLDQDAGCSDALSREHLELLRAQTRRLASFAERTLDVSRLERGQWELEQRPVPFPLTLFNAVGRWQSIAHKHPILASGEDGGPIWAWADEEAVDIILDNLIENATKYSHDGGAVFLSAQEGPVGYITVSVTDQGIGVDPGLRERVFDRFYRVDAGDTQRVYGHGLGLYIVRRLVEAMGGSVWVEAADGNGSRFVFTLVRKSRKSDANSIH